MAGLRPRLWIVPAGLSALVGLLGLGDVLIGITFNEGVAPAVTGLTLAQIEAESAGAYRLVDVGARGGGLTLVALGAALTAISAFAYRGGQRWAWWAAWLLPAWALGVLVAHVVFGFAPGQSVPPSLLSAPVIAAIAAAALVVDAPRFRRQEGQARGALTMEA